jgi:hypothetical protein
MTMRLKPRNLSLFASGAIAFSAFLPAGASAESRALLPCGRLIKCRLAWSVEGASAPAPLIGVVAQDVWWDGRKIIPAGSEVRGTALKPDPARRDRLDAADAFVLVMKGKAPLRVQGRVLEREGEGEGAPGSPAGDLDDGTVGLKASGPLARVDAGHAFYLYVTQDLLTQDL